MRISNDGDPKAGGGRRKLRQIDIARLAGVSQGTVSLVMSGRAGTDTRISPETRDRVLEAVQQLGYAVNPMARSLAGGKNRLLGVFTFESVFPVEQRDFYYPFLLGLEAEAEAQGYDLVLFTSTSAGGEPGERHIYRDGVNRLRVTDGCVLLGREGSKVELARLAREEFPFVFIGRRDLPGHELAYVGADYRAATAAVVRRLVELGHRRIAYLRWPEENEPTRDREAGYRLGHTEAGVAVDPALVLRTHGDAVTPPLLADYLAGGVTAIVAEDVGIARRVLDGALHLGRQVPRDLSVAALTDPPDGEIEWSGLRIPRREMGSRAVGMLIAMLAGRVDPRQVLLPCRVVEGETIGPAPSGGGAR